jgi:DNA-binding transcriptional MocR family regulator
VLCRAEQATFGAQMRGRFGREVSMRMLDLGKGQPDARLLPTELIGNALRDPLVHSEKFLQYGADWGDMDVMDSIAGFLRQRMGLVNPAQLSSKNMVLTAGVSQVTTPFIFFKKGKCF